MPVPNLGIFPFDGECDASKNADLTITFSENRQCLKANSQHLIEASSVLKTALEDCKHNGTLYVGDDDRDAWVLLLNLVHPARQMRVPTQEALREFDKMEVNVQLGRKYAVECMRYYVDGYLKYVIKDLLAAIPKEATEDTLQQMSSGEHVFFRCAKMAGDYDLYATKHACLVYFKQFLWGLSAAGRGGRLKNRSLGR